MTAAGIQRRRIRGPLRSIPAAVFFLSALFLLSRCGGPTEEDVLRETLELVKGHIEKAEIDSIMGYIADDYVDFQNRNRPQTRRMLESAFSQYQGVVMHVLSVRIQRLSLPDAEIEAEILISSGKAMWVRKLVKYAGDVYRVRAEMRKSESRWKLQRAEWAYVEFGDLFPESLKILRKLFPNITGGL